MINKALLIGNLGEDPKLKTLESGIAVCTFSLATNESYKDKNGEWQTLTEWHHIVCWRQLAEFVAKKLKKGMTTYVEGKITHRKYQDKDGNDKYITEIVANTVKCLDKTKSDTGTPNEQYAGGERSNDTPNDQDENDDLPF